MAEEIDELPAGELTLARATLDDAVEMVAVIRAAFGARPPVDPPAPALTETAESVRAMLADGGGVVARWSGELAGVIVLGEVDEETAVLQRVSVHPRFQRHGVASAMVAVVEPYAVELGYSRLELVARTELPALTEFWQHRGFRIIGTHGHMIRLGKDLPVVAVAGTADQMQQLGARLASVLRAGDVIIEHGDLGAGKTTFTQGLAVGLDADGAVISPTFVLSRVHPSRSNRPALVHVDAYRLTSPEELDDLGLDLDDAIVVVEWGVGVAEHLSDDRLLVSIHRAELPVGADASTEDDPRTVLISGHGTRWSREQLLEVVHG